MIMETESRDQSVRELLEAVVALVRQWTSDNTQLAYARELGFDVSANDVRALYSMGLAGGELRPAECATYLGLTRPTTSKLLARLESAGLVARTRSSQDGRSIVVSLTEAGAAMYAALVEAGVEHVARATEDMTSAEITRVTAAASNLVQRLRE